MMLRECRQRGCGSSAPSPTRSTRPRASSWTCRLRRQARLEIFDLAGRRLRTLVDGPLPAGRQQVAWDGRDDAGRALASGTFVCRLSAGDAAGAARLTLVR
ncbi:MAG: hypothetical protein IPH86_09160 [bacterium]|nr:hypothetical protein [bacterium]